MNLLRIRAVAHKEMLQVRRDPLSLALGFLLPVILLLIFGYAITMDINNITTVVRDLDRSASSRELVRHFEASGYFTVTGYAESERELDHYLDGGKARVAISIPPDFSKDLERGRPAPIGVLVDGSDSNTATIAMGYVLGVAELFRQKRGAISVMPRIDPRARVWYNPELKSRNFIVPGLVAVIMAIIAALLTSLTIAREWERGTMEQLISTPVKPSELILGKLAVYFVIGLADVVLSVITGVWLFGVPLKGNVFLLMFFSSIFLFGSLSLGILISINTKSQILASQVSMVVSYLPAFLLSGFMFSIANMPEALQVLTRIIPARYFVTMVKGVFLKGSTLSFLALETVLLSLFGLVVFLIANRRFKKRIG